MDNSCASDKACSKCREDRIQIGEQFEAVSSARRIFGVLLVYAPIFFTPAAIVIALLLRLSFWVLGAKGLRPWRSFVPPKSSHRYDLANQIVMEPRGPQLQLGSKLFWWFNCSYYCPLSVALFEYLTYLVKGVENWWCPFEHALKQNYDSAKLDASYWHVKPGEAGKLHPDDLANPIWNEDSSDEK